MIYTTCKIELVRDGAEVCVLTDKNTLGGGTGKIIISLQITVLWFFKDEILRVFGTFLSIGQSKAPHAQR